MTAYERSPGVDEPLSVIGTLSHSGTGNSFDTFRLTPGGSTEELTFETSVNNIDEARRLATRVSGVNTAIRASSISMTDSEGNTRNFTASSTNVNARTAALTADFGPTVPHKEAETYRVATFTEFNEDYESLDELYEPVYLDEILEALDVEYAVDSNDP